MKSTEFITEDDAQFAPENKTIRGFLSAIVTWWNKTAARDMRIYTQDVGMKVWTRGDGVRMRDPAKILSAGPGNALDSVWDALSKLKGARVVGNVSHEFPSLGNSPAIQYKGLVLVKRNTSIDVMSKSRITNPRSVWKQQQ